MKVKKYTEMMNYLSTSPYQKQIGGEHYLKYKIKFDSKIKSHH